ncbi:MAG: hypothetical protein JWQ25_2227 [Daejeonella sp.]|nr:hypothetical protein [Daejeonella sp.]
MNTKQANHAAEELTYEINPVQTKSVLVKAQLAGIPDPQKLQLTLNLTNLIQNTVQIKEILISTVDGLKSTSPTFNEKSFTLAPNQDTSLSLIFHPVNDMILYQNTELPGILKSQYNVSIVYTIDGKDNDRAVDLVANLPTAAYQQYEKDYQASVQAYHFNTSTQFASRLTAYLNKQKLTSSPAFVHLSDREIAVSGLNFRLKSFQKKDSLYAEILVVNHSDFPIKIDTAKLDFTLGTDNQNKRSVEILLNKVTGSKNEYDVLRKGDRMLISLKQYRKGIIEGKLILTCKNSILLPTGKSLFLDNIELIKVPTSGK